MDFLPQITAFDYPENEDAQDYRSICEQSGWTFVAANKQFHVFCADGENESPMPIHTDHAIHAKIYLKACAKYELPAVGLGLFLLLIWFLTGKDAGLLLSNIPLFSAIGYFFYLIGFIWTLGFIIQWFLRTIRAAKQGLPLPVVNLALARLRNAAFLAGIIILLLCLATGIILDVIGGTPVVYMLLMLMPLSGVVVGFVIRRQIDTKQRTRAGNIGIFVAAIIIMELIFLGGMGLVVKGVLSLPPRTNADSLGERLALALKDIGVAIEPSNTNTHIKGSAVVPVNYDYWESSREGSVNTQVYRAVNGLLASWLYDHFSAEFEQFHADRLSRVPQGVVQLTPEEAAYWGAQKGMAFYPANTNAIYLLLLNGKTILQVSAEGPAMDDQVFNQAVLHLWGG